MCVCVCLTSTGVTHKEGGAGALNCIRRCLDAIRCKTQSNLRYFKVGEFAL